MDDKKPQPFAHLGQIPLNTKGMLYPSIPGKPDYFVHDVELKSKQEIDQEFERSTAAFDELVARFRVSADGMRDLDPRLGKAGQPAKRELTPEAFPLEFTQRVFVKPDFCGPDKPSPETIEFMQRRIAERLREQFEEFSRVLFLGAHTEVDKLCDALDAWLADCELENPR